MTWWRRFLTPWARASDHRVAFSLFTADGSRGIDVHVRRDGLAFYVERERVERTVWKDCEGRPAIGPYESPEAAEAAAIVGPWFSGGES